MLEDNLIKAPLPGNIVDIKASVGKSVKVGDLILILDAMKMQNEITAPIEGIVESINVNVGDNVMTGDVMVTIGE